MPRLNEYEKDCVKWKNGDVVWFPQCNPRNAFIVWMAILGKLYTQDRIQKWNDGILLCPLCCKVNDSHDHLFFKCDYSKEIWRNLKNRLYMDNVPNDWKDIVVNIAELPCNNAIRSVFTQSTDKEDRLDLNEGECSLYSDAFSSLSSYYSYFLYDYCGCGLSGYKGAELGNVVKRCLILKDFKHTLKHKKDDLTLVELGSHLRIEESLRAQDSDKPKGNNVVGPQLDHVHFKRMQDMSKDGLIPAFDMDTEKCERGIECIFVGYAEHSKAFRFFVIEPNESVLINSIIESRDAIFNEKRLSSVPRPSLSIHKGTKDIGGSVVPEKVTEEVVQQPEPELRKAKGIRLQRTLDLNFNYTYIRRQGMRMKFKLCGPPAWKEAMNDEMDSIMGNNTWVLVDLPLGCKPLGSKCIFKRKLKVDETIKKFKARLVIQGFRQTGIYYFDTYAPVAHISTKRLLIAMASIHNLIIHQMDVKTAFLNGELDKEVDLTKKFLSSMFSMKDIGEADVILGIRIKHEKG
ncbi:zinc finger, CCHC-type containing protein [Tanacetum coccineum]